MVAIRAASIALLTMLSATARVAAQEEGAGRPLETDLVEETEARLAQVEISVHGPPDVVATLEPHDFKIKVNLKKIREFQLDRHCPAPGEPEPTVDLRYGPGTYLLFFDQPHLTMFGRARSIDLARDLLEELVREGEGSEGSEGSEAMIVSNARGLSVVHEPSSDLDSLTASLERLERDRTQWDFFAEQEDDRIDEVVRILNDREDVARAIAVARTYQRSERFVAEKSLRRLSVLVGQLASMPPPRAVLYFADTMRQNPGEHYLGFFGEHLRRTSPALGGIEIDGFTAGLPYDRVVNEASAHGVSFFPVLAQGLVTPMDVRPITPEALNVTLTVPEPSRRRLRDTQDSLASLATETGGVAFLRGDSAKRIVERMREERRCIYIASFDPTGFQQDAPLRVVVKSRRDDVRVNSRGRIVLQSEKSRLASRLLGAFALRRGDHLGPDIQTTLIPTGYGEDGYRALLQVAVPATALPGASWDIGASIVHRERVREEVSGKLTVSQPGVAVVLERELQLEPGVHEVISVAHEATSDFVLSDHLQIDWPEPDLRHSVVAPIAVVQPQPGAFSRDGRTRTAGSLGRSAAGTLDAARPTALLSLVCRGRRQPGEIVVERALVGSSEVSFPPLEFDLGKDLCVQVRDVIPPLTLSTGSYSYEMRVLQRDAEVHRAAREIVVGTSSP